MDTCAAGTTCTRAYTLVHVRCHCSLHVYTFLRVLHLNEATLATVECPTPNYHTTTYHSLYTAPRPGAHCVCFITRGNLSTGALNYNSFRKGRGAPFAGDATEGAPTCRSCAIIFVDFSNRFWRDLCPRCHCGSIHVCAEAYKISSFCPNRPWRTPCRCRYAPQFATSVSQLRHTVCLGAYSACSGDDLRETLRGEARWRTQFPSMGLSIALGGARRASHEGAAADGALVARAWAQRHGRGSLRGAGRERRWRRGIGRQGVSRGAVEACGHGPFEHGPCEGECVGATRAGAARLGAARVGAVKLAGGVQRSGTEVRCERGGPLVGNILSALGWVERRRLPRGSTRRDATRDYNRSDELAKREWLTGRLRAVAPWCIYGSDR